MDATQHARIEAIKNALQKLPTYRGSVTRGTNLPSEALAQYRMGEVITEKAFLSTSTSPAVARSPAFSGNVEFRIFSKTGRDVSSVRCSLESVRYCFRLVRVSLLRVKHIDPLTGKRLLKRSNREINDIQPNLLEIGALIVSREIAGKIFSTPEEAGVTPPTEELAEARKAFDEFQAKVDAVAPEDRVTEVSPKLWDDISGTEYDPRRKDS